MVRTRCGVFPTKRHAPGGGGGQNGRLGAAGPGIPIALEEPVPTADVESFYHLADVPLATRSCRGLACFVARHADPDRWGAACADAARVHCLGRCYSAPAGADGTDRPEVRVRAREAVILDGVGSRARPTLALYRSRGGYRALERALEQEPEDVVRAIERSGLRGRGGAAFPTGRKWRAVSEQAGPEKFVVANGDEGDPGAYIDRFILEDDPHVVIEGVAIAAHAIGACRAIIYVRAEYPAARARVQTAVDEARRAGVLISARRGRTVALDLRIEDGRGSFVCGEETALLNAIEGRRPEARPRPPYPAQAGLFGRPTLVNNVETLAAVPWIVERGADAYRALGFSTSRGTKALSLNSLFRRPGLYEVEFGTPLRRIVEELGGGLRTGSLRGVIVGGPLAGVIPPWLLDTPLGFDELRAIGASVGHGGVVAFDEQTNISALVHHVFEFGAYESCGKCTPCRLGARRIEEIFRDAAAGAAPAAQHGEWQDLTRTLALTSLCGHGTGLAEFSASVLRHYAGEVASCFTS
jgi:NADH:ubiquinone oxidoreductase subunit F (NADH-binding)